MHATISIKPALGKNRPPLKDTAQHGTAGQLTVAEAEPRGMHRREVTCTSPKALLMFLLQLQKDWVAFTVAALSNKYCPGHQWSYR
jgi:hypothetical protein